MISPEIDHLHAAVLLPVGGGIVGRDGLCFPEAARGDCVAVQALGDQILPDGGGAVFR